jgi:hypothetical protein
VVVASWETLAGKPGPPAALLNWLEPISGEKARQIGSDGKLTPVLYREGNPLWVGRTQRTVNRKLRLALHLRDGGCTTPGCERRPDWTQGHHRKKWSKGGSTDLANTASQCLRHHPQADAGCRREILPDGRVRVVRPPELNEPTSGPAVQGPPLDRIGRGP